MARRRTAPATRTARPFAPPRRTRPSRSTTRGSGSRSSSQCRSGDTAGRSICPNTDSLIPNRYRSLPELYGVYRNTVGANALLELGVLPDNTGSIPADQMAVLQGLGDYIRTCHSDAAAVARGSGAGLSVRLDFNFTFINRVILQEDLSVGGQIVQAFKVEVLPAGGWVLLATPANEKNLASAAPSSSLTRAH